MYNSSDVPWHARKSGFRRFLRRRRFRHFVAVAQKFQLENPTKELRILDVGGRVNYWLAMQELFDLKKVKITILNLSVDEGLDSLPPNFDLQGSPFDVVSGDATSLQFDDRTFDLAHSNSMIEHLVSWGKMQMAADEIRRVAVGYFVQMPYFWFPHEPHFNSLFFHWLPENLRVKRLLRHRVGWYGPAENYHEALEIVRSARLPDKLQMRTLFPDARIKEERVFLTKSLMAIRGS